MRTIAMFPSTILDYRIKKKKRNAKMRINSKMLIKKKRFIQ